MHGDKCVGAVVCKLDMHKNVIQRGYIAMLAVEKEYRGRKIGMLYKLQYTSYQKLDSTQFSTGSFF